MDPLIITDDEKPKLAWLPILTAEAVEESSYSEDSKYGPRDRALVVRSKPET